jgi:hypothetical protein
MGGEAGDWRATICRHAAFSPPKIAPVSQWMVLNTISEHVLKLPPSY